MNREESLNLSNKNNTYTNKKDKLMEKDKPHWEFKDKLRLII